MAMERLQAGPEDRVDVASLPEYERLVAEIYVGYSCVAVVTEETPGKRVLEAPDPRASAIDADRFYMQLGVALEKLSALDRPRVQS